MTPENLITEIINYLEANTQITSCIIKPSYQTIELLNINNSSFQLNTRTQYTNWANSIDAEIDEFYSENVDTIKSTLVEANIKVDEISRISEGLFKILAKFITVQIGKGMGRVGINILLNRRFGDGYIYKKE